MSAIQERGGQIGVNPPSPPAAVWGGGHLSSPLADSVGVCRGTCVKKPARYTQRKLHPKATANQGPFP